MTLEKLQAEMIAAMKSKNKLRKETISSIVQAVKKFSIDNMCKDNVTEEQIDAIILKEKKTLQEMIDTCPVNRAETLAEYNAKMAVVNEFAPQLMINEKDIENFVNSLNIELVKTNRGKIMAALKGKADMKIANKIIGKMLQ